MTKIGDLAEQAAKKAYEVGYEQGKLDMMKAIMKAIEDMRK